MATTRSVIRIEDNGTGRAPRAYVTSRMKKLLQRLPRGPVTACVRFADVNGPKGGVDIRCGIVVTAPGTPPMEVACPGANARLAFDASFDRVQRRTEEPRRRWRDWQRRPKKYFAARRLWT